MQAKVPGPEEGDVRAGLVERLAGAPPEPPSSEPDPRQDNRRFDKVRLYPIAVALGTLVLGLASAIAPVAAAVGAIGAGALCVLRQRVLALVVVAAMLGILAFVPPASLSPGYWSLIALLVVGAFLPMQMASPILRIAPAIWAVCLVLFAISVAGLLIETGPLADYFLFQGCLCSALLGAGLTRHLAMVDARILAWGEEGLGAVTRDLLLGRITRGMLHDLSQPLNVISMANGNLGYLAERIETDDKTRQHLLERIARISAHTDNAASILSLFRWFGRNAFEDEAGLSVRNALKRAIAATHSNVRYHGIEVELEGNALDLPIARQHGRLEMMGVAALLSALGAYGSAEGMQSKGRIVVFASAGPAHIRIEIRCADDLGKPVACKRLDNATLWLVEQVALEAGGDFRSLVHRKELVQFAIRLPREDI